MPQLYFRHSYIYQQVLAKAINQEYTPSDSSAAFEYANKYAEYWQQYNDLVFGYYKQLGFEFADFWLAYFVYPNQKLTPFSDPLTLFISDDYQEVTCILIHELCHVLQVYPDNAHITNKLLDNAKAVFPNNSLEVNIEVVTILLASGCIEKIFGKEVLDKFSQSERSLSILKDAWKSIDSETNSLKILNLD